MYKGLTLIIITILFLLASGLIAQSKIIIKGRVIDSRKKPIAYVNVFLINTPDGTMSGDDGTFMFSTKQNGKVTLSASMVGYKILNTELNLNSSKNISMTIELEDNAVKFKESIISASSYGSEKEKGLVVSRMDILTTPGGATDIYQALKTMPGVTQVSESAELYVRGGDPIETTTIIDQAIVYHPFTFESGYGGLFSNINQSVVNSLYFTSGGFSAKYGNALSGVLDIETRNIPEAQHYNIGVSMANSSFTAEIPFIENKLGAYFDIRQSFTKPLFWFNGGLDRFTATPTSQNMTGAIVYSYGKTGRLKLFGVYADDQEGVNVERAEYNGTFNGDSKNVFLNLQNSIFVSDNLLMKNSLSFNRYTDLWLLGVVNLRETDHVYNFRNDFEYTVNSETKILSGFEYEDRRMNYYGIIPSEVYDIRPDAVAENIDATLKGTRWGVYSEYQSINPLAIEGLSFTGGIRLDDFPELKLNWIDPRIGLGYKLNEYSNLRFAWGIFHQIPDPRLFASIDGNPNLKAMNATHYIASYEYLINDQNSFRVEIYHKNYENLPLAKPIINYDNSGYGFANGIDVIFKGTLPFGIIGWISYGFINTKRLWMDFTNLASSTADITNNLTLVAKYNLSTKFQIGLNAKYATGRPYTPVASTIYHSDQNIYEPVYTATNSNRFPDYKRVDLRMTYFSQLFERYSVVAYIEGLNILNITNIFGYTYSPDYTQKQEIKSYFGSRMIVFGFSLSI
jgi:hypothetical protein